LKSKGKFLKFGSVCAVLFAIAGPSCAVTFTEQVKSGLGQLSWPNPHHYVNFISSGEYCTSTHFTCERPDYEIQTASLSDVPEFGDIAPLVGVKKSGSYSSRGSSVGQNSGGTGGNSSGGSIALSSPGDSPTGPFNGGGAGRINAPLNPVQPLDPLPPNLSPVPLPSSIWLLFAAILSLGFYRHQSQRIGNLQKLH
jgi:hypothetical protein